VFLLYEFSLEIWDKKGTKNVVADHLSRRPVAQEKDNEGVLPIDDPFLMEHLLGFATSNAPWYADMVNYLVCGIMPLD